MRENLQTDVDIHLFSYVFDSFLSQNQSMAYQHKIILK